MILTLTTTLFNIISIKMNKSYSSLKISEINLLAYPLAFTSKALNILYLHTKKKPC
jgi:hypothetical protein